MEPKYQGKSDIQLNPNILRTKNNKRVLSKGTAKALDFQSRGPTFKTTGWF